MKNLETKVSLFGKHPSSSEYLYIGESSELINSLTKWIEKGYESLLQGRRSIKEEMHHFCFLNKNSDSFVCGTIKPSKDSKNRKYPLVIAIEVFPYSFFKDSNKFREYLKATNKQILKIFEKGCTLEELKKELQKLSVCKNISNDKKDIFSAMFMSEDFSQTEMFFRPLEINDFVNMMKAR